MIHSSSSSSSSFLGLVLSLFVACLFETKDEENGNRLAKARQGKAIEVRGGIYVL